MRVEEFYHNKSVECTSFKELPCTRITRVIKESLSPSVKGALLVFAYQGIFVVTGESTADTYVVIPI
ncbi:hypothetical protein ACROYT_G035347 [Oculina patagonica]